MTDQPPKPAFTIKGWHVLVGLVAFFGLVAAVDALFIVQAYRSFSGEVARNPYEAGLVYNRTLQQRERQAALGWTASVEQAAGEVIVVRVADRTGAAVEGLAISGTLERPATIKGQRTLRFAAITPGEYRADAAPLDGAWDLALSMRGADGARFEAAKRLVNP